MAALQLRWSEQEAAKPYARPFMAMFLDDGGELLGSVAVSGADLLYQRQFVVAVAALAGELLAIAGVGDAADPQGAWLGRLSSLLEPAAIENITPASTFDGERGRVFAFSAVCGGGRAAVVDARTLLEYQDFQAAVAHQAGRLLRVGAVEAEDDPLAQRRAWDRWLRERVARPSADDAIATNWPWR